MRHPSFVSRYRWSDGRRRDALGTTGAIPVKRWAWGPLLACLIAAGPFQDPWTLGSYDLRRDAARQADLPNRLREVSGLATTEDGRLFAHDDERARVYAIDPATGRVLKRIDMGPGGVRGDFEGIAVVGPRIFLVESDGTLYEFAEGEDKEDMPYHVVPTDLGRRCEVEGLAYDPITESLLLACKTTRGRDLRGHLVLFAIPLASLEPEAEPRFKVPYSALKEVGARGRLHPSGVEVHPQSQRIFVVAAREKGLVELNRDGAFVSAAELTPRLHRQPEGVAFLGRDLLLADEAAGGDPTLTVYTLGGPQVDSR